MHKLSLFTWRSEAWHTLQPWFTISHERILKGVISHEDGHTYHAVASVLFSCPHAAKISTIIWAFCFGNLWSTYLALSVGGPCSEHPRSLLFRQRRQYSLVMRYGTGCLAKGWMVWLQVRFAAHTRALIVMLTSNLREQGAVSKAEPKCGPPLRNHWHHPAWRT